jgi:hypothetical protein
MQLPYVDPTLQCVDRKGETCTVSAGDLLEFPDWFHAEMKVILTRLRRECREKRAAEGVRVTYSKSAFATP